MGDFKELCAPVADVSVRAAERGKTVAIRAWPGAKPNEVFGKWLKTFGEDRWNSWDEMDLLTGLRTRTCQPTLLHRSILTVVYFLD